MSARFVEAEGLVHIISPIEGGERTMCGDAFDLDSDVPGYEWNETKSRVVTCPLCAGIIIGCRGVRVREQSS